MESGKNLFVSIVISIVRNLSTTMKEIFMESVKNLFVFIVISIVRYLSTTMREIFGCYFKKYEFKIQKKIRKENSHAVAFQQQYFLLSFCERYDSQCKYIPTHQNLEQEHFICVDSIQTPKKNMNKKVLFLQYAK